MNAISSHGIASGAKVATSSASGVVRATPPTIHEAAIRETHEETGLLIEPGEILGLYSRLEAAIVVLAFEARVVGGEARLNPEALEIQSFAPEAIPWPGIAFKTSYWAIRDWVSRRSPAVSLPDTFRGWEQF